MISQKVKSFLTDSSIETPFLVVDLDIVTQQYEKLANTLPFARCYYSVKSNSSINILKHLKTLNSYFEAASLQEVELCLNSGITSERIHFGNTIKQSSHIQKAYEKGLSTFAFDSIQELQKISKNAPGAKVICRLKTDGIGAVWGLSNKFGCHKEEVISLLQYAKELKLTPHGVSFHVGSQQKEPKAWRRALSDIQYIKNSLQDKNIHLSVINLGGGFPASGYMDNNDNQEKYNIEDFGYIINEAIDDIFGASRESIQFIIEPGRYLIAEAGFVKSKIILSADRIVDNKNIRWIYLDVGKFNGLYEASDIKFPALYETRNNPNLIETILAGPSCDNDDILSVKTDLHHLPDDLKIGEVLLFKCAGAYCNSYVSVSFNGFPPLTEFYI